MSPSNPDAGSTDALRFGLSWPGGERTQDPEPFVSGRGPQAHPDDDDEVVLIDRGADTYAGALPVLEVEAAGASALRRAVIDAYDRLAERVLQRLRAVSEDMDADLAELRSELASLRQAVEDLGDRAPLHHVRASIDELRSDVAGLRRAVLEWPELERISADVAGLRADVGDLLGRRPDITPVAEPSLATFAPLLHEVGTMREELSGEIAGLRHRIALRVSGAADWVQLTDEQVEHIAGVVADRLTARAAPPRQR